MARDIFYLYSVLIKALIAEIQVSQKLQKSPILPE